MNWVIFLERQFSMIWMMLLLLVACGFFPSPSHNAVLSLVATGTIGCATPAQQPSHLAWRVLQSCAPSASRESSRLATRIRLHLDARSQRSDPLLCVRRNNWASDVAAEELSKALVGLTNLEALALE